MLKEAQIFFEHGLQYIPDVRKATVPAPFRGRPEITAGGADQNEAEIAAFCPTGAIAAHPLRIDLGKCAFCGECAFAFPDRIRFIPDHRMATNRREALVVEAGDTAIALDPAGVRKEIRKLFGRSLKLRQVSAGGDNACELELNACGNPNFDMGRFGIEFVASPRHADGVVITGPISENMAEALEICTLSIPEPRIVVLVGTDAISGGIFAGSKALDRSFLDRYPVDLYVPGNPPHPLTFVNGILELVQAKSKR